MKWDWTIGPETKQKQLLMLLKHVAEAWKKTFRHILIKHYITFEFEYLSKFEFILENLLGYETGSQMGSIDKKKQLM
jgi:hypothetical protein